MWSLYQSLEESSPMRFHVYYTLVQLAGKTEQTGAIFTDVETVKSQFSAVPPSNEQMQKLLRLLHEVLLTCKKSDEASAVSGAIFIWMKSAKVPRGIAQWIKHSPASRAARV